MLKDVIRDITDNNTELVIDKVPYDLKNNTYYVLIDPEKPLNQQNIEEILCYKTYNSETFSYDVNNVELRNEILKYLPFSSISKNYVNPKDFDYSNIYFSQNIFGEFIANHSPISSIIDYRMSTKSKDKKKRMSFEESIETLKNHMRDTFNLKTVYFKLETTCGKNVAENILNKVNKINTYLSTEDKLSIEELSDKAEELFNLSYYTSDSCLTFHDFVKTYWVENEKYFNDLNDKIIDRLNLFENKIPDYLNVVYILKTDINSVRENFLNVSRFLFTNSLDSGIILDDKLTYSGKQEIFESSRKSSYANYYTNSFNKNGKENNTKLYLFTESNFMESFNYYLFIVYMINILPIFDINYSHEYKSTLINTEFDNSGKVLLNNKNKDGYLLIFNKNAQTLFDYIEVKRFFSKVTDLVEPIIYDFKLKNEEIIYNERKQLNTIQDVFDEINKEFFTGKLLSKSKSVESIKNSRIKTRVKKLNRDFNDYYFYNKLDRFKNVYYKDLINQICNSFVEYYRYLKSVDERNYYISHTNLINSIQLMSKLYSERGLTILNQSEIDILTNKYINKDMSDLTDKDYLFIVGNLSRVLYNLSKNNSKIRFIEDLYDSKDFPTLVDKFNRLTFKLLNVMDKKYVNKFLELQDIVNSYSDFNLEKLKVEDKLSLMNGFLSTTNLYYTKKQEQNGEN